MGSKPRTRVPSYRKHKASGQAIVTIRGRDIYLGPHGSDASKSEYQRVVAEYLANGTVTKTRRVEPSSNLTVASLTDRYRKYLIASLPDRRKPRNLERLDHALEPLNRIYGDVAAESFGPKALKIVQNDMIAANLARSTINARISILKRVFRWGVSEELIPSSVHHGLQAVEGLRRGLSRAKETTDVKPVAEEDMRAVLPHVVPQVGAMILLQWFTGMRPGEVTTMRGADLDRRDSPWLYRPRHHKTEHHGRSRDIYLGPQAQQVLNPFLKLDPSAYLFSPKDAEQHRKAEMAARRKSKMTPSQRHRAEQRRRNPKRTFNDRYSTVNYRQAIARGCEKAGIRPWHPNQLRHAAATRIRRELGVEAARTVLGHTSATVTEIYAELDRGKALRAMECLG